MGRRIDVQAVAAGAGTLGCELAVLIQRLASGTAARGWQASSPAAFSGCAEKLLPASNQRGLSARRRKTLPELAGQGTIKSVVRHVLPLEEAARRTAPSAAVTRPARSS